MPTKLDVIIIDGYYYPVLEFVTDWIVSEPKETNVYENVPQQIREYLRIPDETKVQITSGSWENDRALFITGYVPHSLKSISELNKYFNNSGFEMGAEFEYMDY